MKEIKLRVHSKKSNWMFKWHGYSGVVCWFFTELLQARSQGFLTAGKIQLHAIITARFFQKITLSIKYISVKFSSYTVYWAFFFQRPSNRVTRTNLNIYYFLNVLTKDRKARRTFCHPALMGNWPTFSHMS